jgi:hypothetical protein
LACKCCGGRRGLAVGREASGAEIRESEGGKGRHREEEGYGYGGARVRAGLAEAQLDKVDRKERMSRRPWPQG